MGSSQLAERPGRKPYRCRFDFICWLKSRADLRETVSLRSSSCAPRVRCVDKDACAGGVRSGICGKSLGRDFPRDKLSKWTENSGERNGQPSFLLWGPEWGTALAEQF